MMKGDRHKPVLARESATERATRDQEVLRANRELAAYFKGRRTEREARAALKIIKAFVRDRERQEVRTRPPLPGTEALKPPKDGAKRKPAKAGQRQRKTRGKQDTLPTRVTVSAKPLESPQPSHRSESNEPTPSD